MTFFFILPVNLADLANKSLFCHGKADFTVKAVEEVRVQKEAGAEEPC